MLVNLRNNLSSPVLILGLMLTVVCYLFSPQPEYMLLLTVAQLIFVPAMVKMVISFNKAGDAIIVAMMLAITLLHWRSEGWIAIVFVLIYVLYTSFIAIQGVKRFLQRGFTNIAEISIDVGLIYLLIGGLWFFAFIANIDTGFSSLITWLTAIHFHYSACLLAISIGLFGRIHKSRWYNAVVVILLTGPLLVAIGITFSTIIEIISVTLYIAAIYSLFFLALKKKLPRGQGLLLRISYGSLCITIIWSFMYAFGYVGIPEMLKFHGFMNGIFFGGVGVLAWAIAIPETNFQPFHFPVSQIRGKLRERKDSHPGLVDALSDFVDTTKLPHIIPHFYEETYQYRLMASVKWKTWFKPFAFIYQFLSRFMQQLNLPFSSKQIEMTGKVVKVDALHDGRLAPRAWIRKIDEQTTFVAIYSKHKTAQTTYMNIALPLPFSTMMGVLYLYEDKGDLHLTSNHDGDAGIYLAINRFLFQLPLQEHFKIKAEDETTLTAEHKMRIFGLPFLEIDYHITKK
ncbi:YndJ family protein [Lysinibacillus sp. BPa_S21]|uniref:YndJ family protein n=1 Tax=Lysinibacillus sp. BPa_S21 TaxID=2932478 RepID=UPI00201256BA|nr:YndJ family protein [Lysinibacillus sp. BPa_S21]MCL1694675.1 YndJ family protein [Lysinibacillus sp. BPa_S21]